MPGFLVDLLKPIKSFLERKPEQAALNLTAHDISAPVVVQNITVHQYFYGPPLGDGLPLTELPKPSDLLPPGSES